VDRTPCHDHRKKSEKCDFRFSPPHMNARRDTSMCPIHFLFHSDRLCEVARLIDVDALRQRDVIRQ
jgi:hypothetical protein